MKTLAQVDIGSAFGSSFGQKWSLGHLISVILSNAIVLAGIILLFLLVFGGISMIISAGQNNPEQAAKGRLAATTAVIGFVIIFAAYWIIQVIENITGLSIFKPGF